MCKTISCEHPTQMSTLRHWFFLRNATGPNGFRTKRLSEAGLLELSSGCLPQGETRGPITMMKTFRNIGFSYTSRVELKTFPRIFGAAYD